MRLFFFSFFLFLSAYLPRWIEVYFYLYMLFPGCLVKRHIDVGFVEEQKKSVSVEALVAPIAITIRSMGAPYGEKSR